MRPLQSALAVSLLACAWGHGAEEQGGRQAAGALALAATRLADAGDLVQAEVLARRAAGLRPGDPAVLAVLGSVLAGAGRHGDASDALEEAARIDPGNLQLRRSLAASQWQAGRLSAAQSNIEAVLGQSPADRHSLLLAGMIAERQGRFSAAAALLEGSGALAFRSPESALALARSYHGLDRLEDARRALGRMDPSAARPEDLAAAGAAAFEAGDYESAAGLFGAAEDFGHPERGRMLFNAALSCLRLDRVADARSALEALLVSEPRNDEAWNLLGWSLAKAGESDRAVEAFATAIEIAPDNEAHPVDLGSILVSRRETWHLAMEVARHGLEQIPNSHRLHQLMGLAQVRQQHFRDAAGSYGRAVALAPQLPDLHLGLIVALWASGQSEQAIDVALGSVERFPGDASLRHQLGRMYLERSEWGDPGTAEIGAARLREAVSLDPGMADAHYELGNLALRQGDLREALASLERASELAPESAKAHYALARCLRRLGRPEEARRAMQAFRDISDHTEAGRRASASP